jgi:IS5 family transposase
MADDYFRARLDQMIDLQHPLALLAKRLPWDAIEARITPLLSRKNRPGYSRKLLDLFGSHQQLVAAGPSAAGRKRLSVRLMVSLLYLKYTYNESDEGLCQRWSQDVYFQFFSGLEYFEPRPPCDPTQIGRFRKLLGEEGVEELLSQTIQTAFKEQLVDASDLENVIIDSTVQSKATAHPTDSRLLEVARNKLVKAAKQCGLSFKQTFEKEAKTLKRKAGGYAHAKQFRRLKKVIKRQRTIVGILLRETGRQLTTVNEQAQQKLKEIMGLVTQLKNQKRNDKNKIYSLHAPEVECIGKGKSGKPYEFGVKTSIVVSHQKSLILGTRTFPSNPYDGHTLNEQLEQSTILMQEMNIEIKKVYGDLAYRIKKADEHLIPEGVELIHRGIKDMTAPVKKALKRRQSIEPVIGHVKQDHGMNRNYLKGAMGDALHAVLCSCGYNIKWLLRRIGAKGLRGLFFSLFNECYRWRISEVFKKQALAAH